MQEYTHALKAAEESFAAIKRYISHTASGVLTCIGVHETRQVASKLRHGARVSAQSVMKI